MNAYGRKRSVTSYQIQTLVAEWPSEGACMTREQLAAGLVRAMHKLNPPRSERTKKK